MGRISASALLGRRTAHAAAAVAMCVVLPVVCSDAEQLDVEQPHLGSSRTLWVEVDADGRPYDVPMPEGGSLSWETLGTLTLPDGDVVITAGEHLHRLTADDPAGITIALGTATDYGLDVVWLVRGTEVSPAGLILLVSGAAVVEWSAFEVAYGTDAGLGAMTSTAFGPFNDTRPLTEKERASTEMLDRLWASARELLLDDLDGVPGVETVYFGNVYGDGGYPMLRGFDADGQLAQLVIWHKTVPWRLAFPGMPVPPDVEAREVELAACLRGEVSIDRYDGCDVG